MKDTESNKIHDDWWAKLIGFLASIFIGIVFVDINSEGQNIPVRVLGLGGVFACLSALLYQDYRSQSYDKLKKKAQNMLLSLFAVLIITAVYFWFDKF